MLSYKQQSPAYSNMCYLLWSHVEFRIVFFLKLFKPLNAAKHGRCEMVINGLKKMKINVFDTFALMLVSLILVFGKSITTKFLQAQEISVVIRISESAAVSHRICY